MTPTLFTRVFSLPVECPGCGHSSAETPFSCCEPRLLRLSSAPCTACLRPRCPLLIPCRDLEIPPRWRGLIRSVESGFWAIGPTFRLLKEWKVHPTPTLTRLIQSGVEPAAARLARSEPALFQRPPWLIPVPQSPARQRQLHGGSALRAAELWRQALLSAGIPGAEILPLLELRNSRARGAAQPQAHLRLTERFLREGRFQISFDSSPQFRRTLIESGRPFWIVDDFLTSGRTLEDAAGCLLRLGALRIDAVVLAIRPLPGGQSEETASSKGGEDSGAGGADSSMPNESFMPRST